LYYCQVLGVLFHSCLSLPLLKAAHKENDPFRKGESWEGAGTRAGPAVERVLVRRECGFCFLQRGRHAGGGVGGEWNISSEWPLPWSSPFRQQPVKKTICSGRGRV